MYCSECGTSNQDGAKFCKECGHRLAGYQTSSRKTSFTKGTSALLGILIIAVFAVIVYHFQVMEKQSTKTDLTSTESPETQTVELVENATAEITNSQGFDNLPTPTTFHCQDSIGCVTYGPDEPIRIASALVISGPNIDLGKNSQYGIEIAIDFKGEIFGHSIELQTEDEGCSAGGGQAAGQKIVSNPTIVAVIGTSCSGAAVTMSEVISESGYVMISPSNTTPSLTDPDQAWNPGYLRTVHNDKWQGKAMADFAYNNLHVINAAAVHDGDSYTESLARAFADSFEELGGTIVEFTAVNKGDTNMRSALSAVAAAGPPEFLYYPVFTAEGGFLTKQAKSFPGLENTFLAAADGMISNAAIEAFGEAGEYMYFSSPDFSFSGDLYNRFIAKYEEKYNTKPNYGFHAYAFDAANMIFACVEEVALLEYDGTMHIGRQSLRDCLYNISGFEGITGILTCDEYGDCADPNNMAVFQLRNGEYVRIWP
ncbi:MAG: ABC transporter substrate-binding protein [Anaerolineales bacterium]|nr:ABC transporter substrate-binding protein [Chloroflexota bacterium]MBL6982000.1 ABC transporter substrate-binding protein [Anaerolineales bacterium]